MYCAECGWLARNLSHRSSLESAAACSRYRPAARCSLLAARYQGCHHSPMPGRPHALRITNLEADPNDPKQIHATLWILNGVLLSLPKKKNLSSIPSRYLLWEQTQMLCLPTRKNLPSFQLRAPHAFKLGGGRLGRS